jgi:hypothetical protein
MPHEPWLKVACNAMAALSFCWFAYDGLARGWSARTTDFPNYYTAARVVLSHADVRTLYEYPDFQRSMNEAGFEEQLGGYVPQTPIACLPFIPLTLLNPVQARRVWLMLNLVLLWLTLWMLSKTTTFRIPELWLIVFCGYPALRQNFVLGQYYVVLAAVIALALYSLVRFRNLLAGCALGVVVSLKLYGAPIVLFLACKRRFRVLAAISAVIIVALIITVARFGVGGMTYYFAQVLPRSLAGETLDPFNPANNSVATMLRRVFIAEPELNPHPLVVSPFAFAFLKTAFAFVVLAVPSFVSWVRRGAPTQIEFAWWVIAMLLISPNTALYTFVLLMLPVALLLDYYPRRQWPLILIPYIVLCLPLRPSWSWTFPKVWLLALLFVVAGYSFYRSIDRAAAMKLTVLGLTASFAVAMLSTRRPEIPAKGAVPFARFESAIYSNEPVVTANGVFYESIRGERFAIARFNDDRTDTIEFSGNVFRPVTADSGEKVYFEIVSHGRSFLNYIDLQSRSHGELRVSQPDPHGLAASRNGRLLAFVSRGDLFIFDGQRCRRLITPASVQGLSFGPGDGFLIYVSPAAGGSQISKIDLANCENTVLLKLQAEIADTSMSPDGKFLIYAQRKSGPWQIWTYDLVDRSSTRLTDGPCNSRAPSWSLDSHAIIFSSDCNRGVNLPALWSMAVPRVAAASRELQTSR